MMGKEVFQHLSIPSKDEEEEEERGWRLAGWLAGRVSGCVPVLLRALWLSVMSYNHEATRGERERSARD